MNKKEQLLQVLFEEVKQEIDRQLQSYKTEINERLNIHVPSGDSDELKEFIREQKKYYEEYFTDEFGRTSSKKFSWEQYQLFTESWTTEELESKVENLSRKKELVHLHARHFLFAEIAGYLNSLVYDKTELPVWEEKKHEVIIRYDKMYRRKNDGITDLTLRETIAFYEIMSQFKVAIPVSVDRPNSNIAMSLCLATGYEKDSIEKEMNNVTPQDYKIAWQKFKEIANNYSPPPK